MLVRVPYTAEYGVNAAKQGFVEANPLQTAIDDDMPVTVDADGQSYSASEIFAGAMQSTHRATILGQPELNRSRGRRALEYRSS